MNLWYHKIEYYLALVSASALYLYLVLLLLLIGKMFGLGGILESILYLLVIIFFTGPYFLKCINKL